MPLTKVRSGGYDTIPSSAFPSGTILQTKTISNHSQYITSNTTANYWLSTNGTWATSEQHGIVLTTKKANSIFNCFFSAHVYYVAANAGYIVTQYSSIGHSTSSTSGYTYEVCGAEYYDSRSGDTSVPGQRQNTPSGGVSFSLSHAAGTTIYFALKSIYNKVGNENGQVFTVHEVAA